MSHVWYVSYGSNMSAARLACYLQGGCPPGGSTANPGARDATPPVRSVPVDLPGTLYFAGDSRQWSGGVAFYDHDTPGFTAARAYLITAGQLADVAAQEMYRAPAQDDPVESLVLAPLAGGRHVLGPGHYETLVEVGRHDDLPLLTFTSAHPSHATQYRAPSPAYRAMLAEGLAESRAWSTEQSEAYLDQRVPPIGRVTSHTPSA